jgi:glycosyltransferase involved in cell wall biosynthesis
MAGGGGWGAALPAAYGPSGNLPCALTELFNPGSKKMKAIWLFNHYASTPEQAGGSRHYTISRILASRGYRVTLFASSFSHHKHEDLKCGKNENSRVNMIDGVRFVWIKTLPYKKNNWKRVVNMLSYSWRCSRIYKKLLKENQVEKPEVVIGSAVHLFAVWTAYRISKKLGATFVMEVRDLWPMTLVEFRKGLKYHPIVIFFGILERFLAKRAQKIISVLPGAYDYYKRYGIKKEDVVWIPNGVDTGLYHPGLIPGEPGSQGRFKVIYTGTFGREANLQTLLLAAKALKEKGLPIFFELVGSGEKQKELVELKNKLELDNVAFAKPVGKEKIPALLAAADVAWIGTRKLKELYKYGFSFNKLFEYLAAGKPIVFSIDSDYNPVNESGAGLTVPPEDPDGLCEAIIRIYNMPQTERIKMGQKGIAYVKKIHEMERLADQFEQLLSSL